MIKKCLIFLLILAISYLYPINSEAQETEKKPLETDVCSCLCKNPLKVFSTSDCKLENHYIKYYYEKKFPENRDDCRKYNNTAHSGYQEQPFGNNDFACLGNISCTLYDCRLLPI